MKKRKLFLLTLPLLLTSCNMQLIDLDYKFTKAHLVSAEKCVSIKSWNNYEDGDMVQITLNDGTTVLGHSNEIVLIDGTCPYCNK